MKEEIERIKILLGINYFLHQRMYLKSSMGFISKEEALKVLWRNHNIPKEECNVIIKSLEIMGLIEEDGEYFKIKKPEKEREELIFDFRKKLKLII
jgi:hypothetical protein